MHVVFALHPSRFLTRFNCKYCNGRIFFRLGFLDLFADRTWTAVSGIAWRTHAPSHGNVVCVLWVLSFILGGWIYSEYRIAIRIPMEQQELFKTVGTFELKEHMAVFGLGLLPYYRYLWKNSVSASEESARRWVTVFLAAACWYTFLAGHIVNNARGFGS